MSPHLSFLILENYFDHSFLRSSVSFGSPACSYIWVLIRSFLFSNRAMTVESQLSAMKSEEIEKESQIKQFIKWKTFLNLL